MKAGNVAVRNEVNKLNETTKGRAKKQQKGE
jgi:hypothetical protein